ncbi:hypothetical protein HYX10_06060 [Candidatus Woesearchaeota archaeon]|nr:hypothetical protein [Candidatus Woesearchaeota archaeon]
MIKKEAAAIIIVAITALVAFLPDAGSQLGIAAVETSCRDTGEFVIRNLDEKEGVYARIGTNWAEVEGEWRDENNRKTFRSEEAVFISPKASRQSVRVGKSSYSLNCPAFVFSCKLINISINACYKRNDTFYGRFTAYSLRYDKQNEFRFEKPFLLDYEIKTSDGKELTHGPQILSPEFRQIAMSRAKRVGSNRFTLMWNTTKDIERFTVQYQQCDNQKYNFYDSVECTDLPTCASNSECAPNEACEDNLCIPLSCGACQYTANHACADYECCGNNDCAESEECADNKCASLNCAYNEAAAEHECRQLACGNDEYIFNGTCAELECEQHQAAVNHVCAECGQDETSENNQCTKLSCGFLKKAKGHECASIFRILFGK